MKWQWLADLLWESMVGGFEAVSSHWKEMHLLMCSSFGKGMFNSLPSRKCWIDWNKRSSHSSHPFSERSFKCYLFLKHSSMSSPLSLDGFCYFLSSQIRRCWPSKTFLSPRSGSTITQPDLCLLTYTVKLVAETRLGEVEVQHYCRC